MAYRNIYLSKPSTLAIEDANLRIKQEGVDLRIPVEDILSVMVEDSAVTLNSFLISHLAQHDVLIFTCDRTHLPCAVLSPFAFHTTQVRRTREQIAQTVPFCKQLWSGIVRAKINNQAICLDLGGHHSQDLHRMSQEVRSGDSDNRESVAARTYFSRIFGEDFTRDQDSMTNACLNYGYAILRGVVARSLTAHGFSPDLGVHHCSELNNFNLADDFIEPLRPSVDIVVMMDTSLRGKGELHKDIKQTLYGIMNQSISFDSETHSIGHSIDLMIESYIRCIKAKDPRNLVCPVLQSPRLHETS